MKMEGRRVGGREEGEGGRGEGENDGKRRGRKRRRERRGEKRGKRERKVTEEREGRRWWNGGKWREEMKKDRGVCPSCPHCPNHTHCTHRWQWFGHDSSLSFDRCRFPPCHSGE
jgi:hypothetical protein